MKLLGLLLLLAAPALAQETYTRDTGPFSRHYGSVKWANQRFQEKAARIQARQERSAGRPNASASVRHQGTALPPVVYEEISPDEFDRYRIGGSTYYWRASDAQFYRASMSGQTVRYDPGKPTSGVAASLPGECPAREQDGDYYYDCGGVTFKRVEVSGKTAYRVVPD